MFSRNRKYLCNLSFSSLAAKLPTLLPCSRAAIYGREARGVRDADLAALPCPCNLQRDAYGTPVGSLPALGGTRLDG